MRRVSRRGTCPIGDVKLTYPRASKPAGQMCVKLIRMPLIALQTCLALLLAFFVAPFQHVHPGGTGADHDHAAVVHAHFYSVHVNATERRGSQIAAADDDDHDAVWSVDTFTLALTAAIAPFIASRGSVLRLFQRKFSRPSRLSKSGDTTRPRSTDPSPEPLLPNFPKTSYSCVSSWCITTPGVFLFVSRCLEGVP